MAVAIQRPLLPARHKTFPIDIQKLLSDPNPDPGADVSMLPMPCVEYYTLDITPVNVVYLPAPEYWKIALEW